MTNENKDKDLKILNYQVQMAVMNKGSKVIVRSEHKNPTLYFGNLSKHAIKLKESGSSIVFLGDTFVFGLLTDKSHLDFGEFKEMVKGINEKA